MVNHYQEEYKRMRRRRSPIVTMIVYRMNVWNKDRNVLFPKDNKPVNAYLGRKDFGVEINFEGLGKKKPYELLCFNKDCPPINPSPCENRSTVSKKKSSFEPHPHCQITGPTYLDDYVWIESLNNEYETFVNGKKVASGRKHMLMDGDIIALGSPHGSTKDFWGKDKEKRGFVFKVKSLRVGCKVDEAEDVANPLNEPSPAYLALNNVLVMDNIMKFLTYDELKPARGVNKFWMENASRLLFPRTCAKFFDFDEFRTSDYAYTTEMINKHDIGKWEIHFDEYYERVQSLVMEKGLIVRTLSLSITLNSQKDVTKLETLLSHFPNLEVLQLMITRDEFCLLQFSSAFDSVKELGVKIRWEGNYFAFTREHQQKYGLVSFPKSFPNVRSFSDEQCSVTVRSSVLVRLDNSTGHPLCLWRHLTQITAYFDDTVIQAIQTLPQNLTSLDLKDLKLGDKDISMDPLKNMIDRHSATLEHLALQGFGSPEGSLALPRCPKLKSLEVHFSYGYMYQVGTLPNPHPEILFASGSSISYERDFPQLQTLSVMTLTKSRGNSTVVEEVDMEAILDVFVPKDSDTVCKTMRWINFRLPNGRCTKNNAWFKDFVGSFHRMFPHVHHPQVNLGLKLLNLQ